jgi:hypothetical protein
MLLNLLKRLHVKEIAIAGFDGFIKHGDNYFDQTLHIERLESRLDEINEGVRELLSNYISTTQGSCTLSMITPSLFSDLFSNAQ